MVYCVLCMHACTCVIIFMILFLDIGTRWRRREMSGGTSGASVRGFILCVLVRNFNVNACHFWDSALLTQHYVKSRVSFPNDGC